MTLADYAAKNGATATADAACDGAIAMDPKLRPAWQKKLQLAQAASDTTRIHALLEKIIQHWPNDSAIQNDEAYTKLLLLRKSEHGGLKSEEQDASSASAPPTINNKELITVEQLAQQLVQRAPASLPHRTLLALVYLKENRPATALGVYENLNIPAHALTPPALAVHAAVLAANGNTAGAAKEAARIPRSVLLPEESALISNL